MYDTLTQMGVAVVQLHAEAGNGQFEFVTGHGPAMQACSFSDGAIVCAHRVP